MSLKNQNVTILGAGIGGLTAAVAMSRRGANVTVFDQTKRQSSIGAGIQVSPNGFGVMDTLGLAAQLFSKGNVLEFINVQNYKNPLFSSRVDLMRVTHGNPNPHLVIHRSDLIGILIKKTEDLGVKVHFNKKAESINYDDKEIQISFNDGTVHKTRMLVGADGIHSIARTSIGCKAQLTFTGKVAWRAMIESKFVPLTDLPSEATIRFGPNRHLVTYPIRERSFEHWPTDVLKLLSVAENVNLWGLFFHSLPKKWHSASIVLIGDSCHPMVPFLGQGANMAIEDAWVLAEELDGSIDMEDGFKKYQSRRYKRIKKVSLASSSNGDIYHAVGVKANIIDLGMKASYKFKPSFIQSKYDWLYGVDVSRGD